MIYETVDFDCGHRNLDTNKVQDILDQNGVAQSQEDAGEQQIQQDTANV